MSNPGITTYSVPLRVEEVPEHLRTFIDFSVGYKRAGKQRNAAVWATCPNCRQARQVPVSRIRQSTKQGIYTGLCWTCNRKSFEHGPNWKGGRWVDFGGYVRVHMPKHPKADRHGYVREHRLVMEKKLGRYLEPHETVHHINGRRDDNRPENLELWTHKHISGVRISEAPHCPTCTCLLNH